MHFIGMLHNARQFCNLKLLVPPFVESVFGDADAALNFFALATIEINEAVKILQIKRFNEK